MKFLAHIVAAAALLFIGAIIVSSGAFANSGDIARNCEPTLRGWHCDYSGGLKQFKGTQAEIDRMYAFLKKVRYPGEIVVTTQEDFDRTVGGWNKRLNCRILRKEDTTRDWLVNHAKIYYCQLAKKGWPVPKPKIIKQF